MVSCCGSWWCFAGVVVVGSLILMMIGRIGVLTSIWILLLMIVIVVVFIFFGKWVEESIN